MEKQHTRQFIGMKNGVIETMNGGLPLMRGLLHLKLYKEHRVTKGEIIWCFFGAEEITLKQ